MLTIFIHLLVDEVILHCHVTMEEVRHHLVDILNPSEDYSVGQFFEDARRATRDIIKSGRVPIVAGGTGLYLRWYIYGKPDVPKASPEITSKVYSELMILEKNEDWDAAVQLVVKAGDPKAQFVAANDWYRLRHSLEIIKNVAVVTSTSTHTPIYKAFDRGEYIGDVTAKGECVGNIADLVAIEYDIERATRK